MPPEQVRDAKTPDIRCDIYSLGATFYRFLCGEPPITGNTIAEFLKNLKPGSIAHPSQKKKEITKEMGDWIMGAVAFDPDERYGDIRTFINGLKEIYGAE